MAIVTVLQSLAETLSHYYVQLLVTDERLFQKPKESFGVIL